MLIPKDLQEVEILGRSVTLLAEAPLVYMNSQTLNSNSNAKADKVIANKEKNMKKENADDKESKGSSNEPISTQYGGQQF